MKKNIIMALLFIAAISANAQKLVKVSGDAKVLKGAGMMLVEYDYSDFGVGEFSKEGDYVGKKVEELNAKEKGKGNSFKQKWDAAKVQKYPAKFEDLFNKTAEAIKLKISPKAKAPKYVLIVKTVFIEPGFNVGVMKRPSAVSFEFTIVEAENRSNIIAEYTLKNVPGVQAAGFDYDASTRIAESYAKAAKILAKGLIKELK